MSEINVPLLQKVLDHITAHPDEHRQDNWARRDLNGCGTACCVAGWAALMSGHELQWKEYGGCGDPHCCPIQADAATTTSGQTIEAVATEELGLTHAQADRLFAGGNELAELWWLAARYTSGALEVPDQFRDLP